MASVRKQGRFNPVLDQPNKSLIRLQPIVSHQLLPNVHHVARRRPFAAPVKRRAKEIGINSTY
jgi:hypothetical protein